jgi:hypothetical protein
MIELCGRCGHELDHRGKRCGHDVEVMEPSALTGGGYVPVTKKCACPDGIRADVFLSLQMSELIQTQRNLIAVLMFVHDVEVGPNGKLQHKSVLHAVEH